MRPRPEINPSSKPFWDGAARGSLVLQRCNHCGKFDHPPFPECTHCRSTDLTFEEVSGRGSIYQRVVVTAPVVSGFEDRVPYACIVVEIEEQQGCLIPGALDAEDLYEGLIGTSVQFGTEDGTEEPVLPVFRVIREESDQ